MVAERSFTPTAGLTDLFTLVPSNMASVIKNPPTLDDVENYERWKEDVLMWKEVTDVSKNKQALVVHLTLKGQAREVANQVSTDDKRKDNGLELLLDKLDEAFLKEPERRKFMAYQNFEECTRKDGVPICDFMREFDAKYYKMKEKGMVLPDEVLAFRLVKNCKLTEVQKDQVMASTKPLSFKEVRATLKRMFESSAGCSSDFDHGVQVKEEPLYVTKTDDKQEQETRCRQDSDSQRNREEDVMWTTNYRNQRGYGRSRGRRYSRWSRQPRRNWGSMGYDNGCFECGSKDHWARNCDGKKEESNKES